MINKVEAEELSEKWLGGIELNHIKAFKKELKASFPEELYQYRQRINDLTEDWIQYHSNSGEKVAHYIFSHEVALIYFVEYINSKDKKPKNVKPDKKRYNTAIASATIKGKSVRL